MWKPALIAAVTALQMGFWISPAIPAAPEIGDHAHAECLGEHHCYALSDPATIPDNDPAGITIGPLRTARDAHTIRGLLVSLSISHTYSGELTISLHYDTDRDGDYDASSVLEIYLARTSPCEGTELWAYPIELSGTYFFKDEEWDAAGEVASLTVFEGLDAGGDFYLKIADDAPGNTGVVSDWAVYAETTASEEGSRRLMRAGASRRARIGR